jgi:membrane protein
MVRSLPVRIALHTHRDDATFLAAGVALYLLLGLLPTLAAVVAIYALYADPVAIQGHLAGLDRVVPDAVFQLIVEQLRLATTRSSDELGFAAAGAVVFALYSARAAADAVLTAIEHVDGAPPRWRGWWRVGFTLALALGALASLITLLAAVVAVPATSATLDPSNRGLLFNVRWPVLIAIGLFSLTAVYGLGGPRRPLRLVMPGAIAATGIGLLASFGVSYYVTELAGYQNLYGAFGGAMIVLLWFYVVALAVVIGAVVNAELAHGPAT